MIDPKAFQMLQCGLHIVTTATDTEVGGCVVNTVIQATATPPQLVVIIHKDNYTANLIQKSGKFCAVALSETTNMELIVAFGFHTSADYDKFADFPPERDPLGIPYVEKYAEARFSCRVISVTDAGTHLIFLGEVVDAERIGSGHAMTYGFYHSIKRGFTPPNASSYVPPVARGFRCKVCGYLLDEKHVPADFVCPVCHQGPDAMQPLT